MALLDQEPIRSDAITDRAITYLLDQQRPDGSFLDFWVDRRKGYPTTVDPKWQSNGGSDSWITAYVCEALGTYRGSDVRGNAAIERATEFLISKERENGGWGTNDWAPVDCDATSRAILTISKKAPISEKSTSAFLSHQRDDGGFAFTQGDYGSWAVSHADVTGLALQVLGTLGAQNSEAAARATKFLISHRLNGGWNSFWHRSPLFATAQAARGLRLANAFAQSEISGQIVAFADFEANRSDPIDLALLLDIYSSCDPQLVGNLAESFEDMQAIDGRWTSKMPSMRMPNVIDLEPWLDAEGEVLFDRRAIYSTASVLRTLVRLRTIA